MPPGETSSTDTLTSPSGDRASVEPFTESSGWSPERRYVTVNIDVACPSPPRCTSTDEPTAAPMTAAADVSLASQARRAPDPTVAPPLRHERDSTSVTVASTFALGRTPSRGSAACVAQLAHGASRESRSTTVLSLRLVTSAVRPAYVSPTNGRNAASISAALAEPAAMGSERRPERTSSIEAAGSAKMQSGSRHERTISCTGAAAKLCASVMRCTSCVTVSRWSCDETVLACSRRDVANSSHDAAAVRSYAATCRAVSHTLSFLNFKAAGTQICSR